ncbi:hypothetical protein F5883DRAFT_590364 [Diaporthe sp. PMI_573]|nr:hypothetical protein F5883DRAFT_590364 [Diaporthaceae sp. PMI_573]
MNIARKHFNLSLCPQLACLYSILPTWSAIGATHIGKAPHTEALSALYALFALAMVLSYNLPPSSSPRDITSPRLVSMSKSCARRQT